MMNETSVTDLRFSDTHLPAVPADTYTLTTTTTLEINGSQVTGSQFQVQSTFTVSGERFSLDAAQIGGTFPSAGAQGDFSSCLPHILLTRSTLPWERSPYSDGTEQNGASWLGLLVFSAETAPPVQTVQASALQTAATASPWFPAYVLQDGQAATDTVAVIDVPVSQLQAVLPAPADLPYLAHVRQPMDASGDVISETAVVLSNSLPPSTGLTMVFLVSLEDRYTDQGFDYQSAGQNDLIRFISLKYWRFTTDPSTMSFSQLMQDLSQTTLSPVIPATAQSNQAAMDRLTQGYVALSYQLRDGSSMPGWYRGPLIAGTDSGQLPATLPVLCADALLTYDPSTCFFDVTYAAAWELGRLMMLSSPAVANALYLYKLALQQAAATAAYLATNSHLRSSLRGLTATAPSLPDNVSQWFEALTVLQNIPFEYLIADDAMIPLESIHFFTLDSNWLNALFDGALSIGRITEADQVADGNLPAPANSAGPVTGFLLRSAVVAGWPNLSITGYNAIPTGEGDFSSITIPTLTQNLLSSNTLLCLFNGVLQAVDIQPVPEVLHSGLDGTSGAYVKNIRDPQTGDETSSVISPLPWISGANEIALSFSSLATGMEQPLNMQSVSSSGFALQMIQSEFCARLEVGAAS